MLKVSFSKAKAIYLMIAVPVLFYFFMVIVPTLISGYYSAFNWAGGTSMTFVGLDNYKKLLTDLDFWRSVKNTLVFTGLMVLGQVGIAFVFTLFFTMKWVRLKAFHRFVMFLPSVIAPVVIGLMWQLIYNRDMGLLNYMLNLLGLNGWIQPWLDKASIVLYSVSAPVIWQFVGYYLVIMTGAVGAIPPEIFESADLDGATGLKRSLYITIPMIRDTVNICVMLSAIGSMKAFDHIMVMTGGGPGTSTMVMGLYAYQKTFTTQQLGYGNAIAIGILLLTLAVALPLRLLRGRDAS